MILFSHRAEEMSSILGAQPLTGSVRNSAAAMAASRLLAAKSQLLPTTQQLI
jgi:hypothetical protein